MTGIAKSGAPLRDRQRTRHAHLARLGLMVENGRGWVVNLDVARDAAVEHGPGARNQHRGSMAPPGIVNGCGVSGWQ